MVYSSSTRASLLYIVVAIILATLPIFFGRFYLIGDMHDVFLPLEDFFRQEQVFGRIPAWNPDIAWGFPVIASAQIGFFYPPLLLLRILPVTVYLPFVLILHLVALAFGTYLVARREGISDQGALIAAFSMSMSSFVFQHLTHLNIILALAWLPWQFLASRRLTHSPTLQNKALFALTIGLPFLAGHVHIPFLLALITTTYFLITSHKKIPRQLLTTGAILAVAAALAAAQLFPTWELLHYSSRGEGGDFALERANQLSWPPYHLPTLIFPRFFSVDSTYWGKRLEVEYGIFLGTLPLLLALSTLKSTWRHHRFFVIAAGISFVLSLGDMSPIRLLGLEPSLWYFSAPARWLLLYTFAISILAGAGFDYMMANPKKMKRAAQKLLIFLATSVILGNILMWTLPSSTPQQLTHFLGNHNLLGERPLTYYDDKFTSLIHSLRSSSVSLTSPYSWLPFLLLISTITLSRSRHFSTIVVGLCAAELILISATTTPAIPWHTILTPPASLSKLPQQVLERQARIYSVPPEGDTGLFLTNPATRPNINERIKNRELLLPASHARYAIAGSTWPASLDLQSHSEALQQLSLEELNIGAVLETSMSKQNDDITIRTISPLPRAALQSETTLTPLPYPTENPNKLSWTVDTGTEAKLIVRDTWYPGWLATIDEIPVPIERYKNIFRSVTIPSGQHTITMYYQPASHKWGIGVSSCVSILLILVLGYRPLAQRIRR